MKSRLGALLFLRLGISPGVMHINLEWLLWNCYDGLFREYSPVKVEKKLVLWIGAGYDFGFLSVIVMKSVVSWFKRIFWGAFTKKAFI